MNPNEKAKQLIQRIRADGSVSLMIAKRIAPILCDEIIEALKSVGSPAIVVDDAKKEIKDMQWVGGTEYWQRVKIGIKLI